MKSLMRSWAGRRFWSQNSVMGTPWTSSMTKYGRPVSVAPPSSTLAIFGFAQAGEETQVDNLCPLGRRRFQLAQGFIQLQEDFLFFRQGDLDLVQATRWAFCP
jgi:hypothetical protein